MMNNGLTSKQIRNMTHEQIVAYWKAEQTRKRANGEQAYDTLIEVQADGSDKIIANAR